MLNRILAILTALSIFSFFSCDQTKNLIMRAITCITSLNKENNMLLKQSLFLIFIALILFSGCDESPNDVLMEDQHEIETKVEEEPFILAQHFIDGIPQDAHVKVWKSFEGYVNGCDLEKLVDSATEFNLQYCGAGVKPAGNLEIGSAFTNEELANQVKDYITEHYPDTFKDFKVGYSTILHPTEFWYLSLKPRCAPTLGLD